MRSVITTAGDRDGGVGHSGRSDISLSRRCAAQDRVAEVISAARKALGGEDKVAGLKGLTAEGPFRRTMGGRDMEGTSTVTIARPDKMKRVDEMQMGGMVGGPTIERTSVLNGTTAWDDTANRGGMGGGMQIVMRGPGEGPGPGGGAAPTPGAAERSARAPDARAAAAPDGGIAGGSINTVGRCRHRRIA